MKYLLEISNIFKVWFLLSISDKTLAPFVLRLFSAKFYKKREIYISA